MVDRRVAAAAWGSVSAALGAASTTAAAQRLSDSQFSALGAAAGVHYRHVQEMLARFLREGEYYTNYVAVSLRKSTPEESI